MHIRPIQPSDFSATASMAVSSFSNDKLFCWTHRYKDQYPDYFRRFFLGKLKSRYWAIGCFTFVAVLDEGDKDYLHKGQVVGYAGWERQGKGDIAKTWRESSLQMAVESVLLQLEEYYFTLTRADKSIDYDRLHQYIHIENFGDIPEIWRLRGLGIDPAFQGRGIAGKLLEWGQEQASRESCPIGLLSSPMAEAVYLKKGFREYCRVFVGDGIEVPVMIWEPRGMEGKWGVQGTAEVVKEKET